MVDGDALSGGAGGVTGAVARARIALRAALDDGVVGVGQSSHCHGSLGIHALSADPGASDSLGVLQVTQQSDMYSCCQGHESSTARSTSLATIVTVAQRIPEIHINEFSTLEGKRTMRAYAVA